MQKIKSGNLRVYEGLETKNRPTCTPLELHKLVKQFDCPSVLEARVPVVSNLNIDSWKFHLSDYWDKQVVDLREFRFPHDFDNNTVLLKKIMLQLNSSSLMLKLIFRKR